MDQNVKELIHMLGTHKTYRLTTNNNRDNYSYFEGVECRKFHIVSAKVYRRKTCLTLLQKLVMVEFFEG